MMAEMLRKTKPLVPSIILTLDTYAYAEFVVCVCYHCCETEMICILTVTGLFLHACGCLGRPNYISSKYILIHDFPLLNNIRAYVA